MKRFIDCLQVKMVFLLPYVLPGDSEVRNGDMDVCYTSFDWN